MDAAVWVHEQLRRHRVRPPTAADGLTGTWRGRWNMPGERLGRHGPNTFVQEMAIDSARGIISGFGSDCHQGQRYRIDGTVSHEGGFARLRWTKTYIDRPDRQQVDYEGVVVGGAGAGTFVNRTARRVRGTFALSRGSEPPSAGGGIAGAVVYSAVEVMLLFLGLLLHSIPARPIAFAFIGASVLLTVCRPVRSWLAVQRCRHQLAALSSTRPRPLPRARLVLIRR